MWFDPSVLVLCVAVSCLSDRIFPQPQHWAPAPAEPAWSAPAFLASSRVAEQQLELRSSEPELRPPAGRGSVSTLRTQINSSCCLVSICLPSAVFVREQEDCTTTLLHFCRRPNWPPPPTSKPLSSSDAEEDVAVFVLDNLDCKCRCELSAFTDS